MNNFCKISFLSWSFLLWEPQNPKWVPGAPKWPTGSGKGCTPRFLGAPVNFRKISFLIRALLLWEKVVTEERKVEKKRIVTIVKIEVHYCCASQPPERRLTGTATACAKMIRSNEDLTQAHTRIMCLSTPTLGANTWTENDILSFHMLKYFSKIVRLVVGHIYLYFFCILAFYLQRSNYVISSKSLFIYYMEWVIKHSRQFHKTGRGSTKNDLLQKKTSRMMRRNIFY